MYLRTVRALVYLATGLDVFERKVAGWALSGGLETSHTTIPTGEYCIARKVFVPVGGNGVLRFAEYDTEGELPGQRVGRIVFQD
jgi:hypothetical protein